MQVGNSVPGAALAVQVRPARVWSGMLSIPAALPREFAVQCEFTVSRLGKANPGFWGCRKAEFNQSLHTATAGSPHSSWVFPSISSCFVPLVTPDGISTIREGVCCAEPLRKAPRELPAAPSSYGFYKSWSWAPFMCLTLDFTPSWNGWGGKGAGRCADCGTFTLWGCLFDLF